MGESITAIHVDGMDFVPMEDFQRVVQERDELRGFLAASREQVQALRPVVEAAVAVDEAGVLLIDDGDNFTLEEHKAAYNASQAFHKAVDAYRAAQEEDA